MSKKNKDRKKQHKLFIKKSYKNSLFFVNSFIFIGERKFKQKRFKGSEIVRIFKKPISF